MYLHVLFLTANCGPKKLFVTDQTKILASHNYSSSTDIFSCSWIFELNPKAPVLMLHFSDLEFGNSNDCLFDYLELSYTQVNIDHFYECHSKEIKLDINACIEI